MADAAIPTLMRAEATTIQVAGQEPSSVLIQLRYKKSVASKILAIDFSSLLSADEDSSNKDTGSNMSNPEEEIDGVRPPTKKLQQLLSTKIPDHILGCCSNFENVLLRIEHFLDATPHEREAEISYGKNLPEAIRNMHKASIENLKQQQAILKASNVSNSNKQDKAMPMLKSTPTPTASPYYPPPHNFNSNVTVATPAVATEIIAATQPQQQPHSNAQSQSGSTSKLMDCCKYQQQQVQFHKSWESHYNQQMKFHQQWNQYWLRQLKQRDALPALRSKSTSTNKHKININDTKYRVISESSAAEKKRKAASTSTAAGKKRKITSPSGVAVWTATDTSARTLRTVTASVSPTTKHTPTKNNNARTNTTLKTTNTAKKNPITITITPSPTGTSSSTATPYTDILASTIHLGPPKDNLKLGEGRNKWPAGWTKTAKRRNSGVKKGRVDSYWYSPKLKLKFRSMNEVRLFLLAMEAHNGDEAISKSQMYLFKEKEAFLRRAEHIKNMISNNAKTSKKISLGGAGESPLKLKSQEDATSSKEATPAKG